MAFSLIDFGAAGARAASYRTGARHARWDDEDGSRGYRNVTVAIARLTLSGGQKVTGPGAAPGVLILVPWPGRFRICWPAAFETLTTPSIRNTPST